MPTRIASVTKKIAANGQALHRAMMRRMQADDAGQAPSDAEAALIEERKALKEEREKRKAQALLPRPSALDRLVRTHHPEAKGGKVKKAHADDTKKPKARKTRAEKHAEKAAAAEAARHTRSATAKKPAK
jgi:hypothetical protein